MVLPLARHISLFTLCALLFFQGNGEAFSLSRNKVVHGASRTFELVYTVNVDKADGAGNLRMWLPYITTNDAQEVLDVKVESPYKVDLNFDPEWGNGMLYLSSGENPGEAFTVQVTYKIRRWEQKTKSFDYKSPIPEVENSGQFDRNLKPSKYVVVNDSIAKYVDNSTDVKGNRLAKVKGVYDFIIGNMEYNKEIPGWGKGDVNRICLAIDGGKSGTGNCTDFHSLFSSMLIAQNVPVVFEMGYPLTPGKDQLEPKKGGYHCWAKFFLPGYGWVPVDISEARKDLSKKNYFWGSICENRVTFSKGRDIQLVPAQQGERLNFFGPDPYIEVDGQEFKGFERKIAYRNLD